MTYIYIVSASTVCAGKITNRILILIKIKRLGSSNYSIGQLPWHKKIAIPIFFFTGSSVFVEPEQAAMNMVLGRIYFTCQHHSLLKLLHHTCKDMSAM